MRRDAIGRILVGIPLAALVVDRDGQIVHANALADRLFGYEPGELSGRPVDLLVPEHLRDAHRHARTTYFANPSVREMGKIPELLALRKDGGEIPVEIGVGPLRSGGSTLVMVTIREASATKQTPLDRGGKSTRPEDERLWLRALIERLPIGIILVLGSDGERIEANRRAEALFGHPLPPEGGAGQLVGRICWPNRSPCPHDDLPTVRAVRGSETTGEELLLRRLDGREIPILVSASSIRDPTGAVVGAVVAIDDLTPIKEIERVREEWTSIIAHDLRQPVTVITGYASQLARRDDRSDDSWRRAVEHILTCSQQLNRMISDLLDSSRLEARRLTLQWQMVDLAELIAAVVERTAEVTRGHAVHVTIASPNLPRVRADPNRLEQVLGNLLSNAAKYAYDETDIHVEVKRLGREIEIAVGNDGDGIPSDELPRLFTRFHRPAHRRSSTIGGLGLGLYISRALVEAHGGRIWVDSTPRQRTTFHFTIPEYAGDH